MKERELHLWQKVRDNHRPAFAQLYEQTVEGLYAYGRRFCEEEIVIEESIQELYIDLWVKRKQIDIHSSFRYYLLKSFRRLLLKKLQAKRKSTHVPFTAGLVWSPGPEMKIVAAETDKERIARVKKASEVLSPRQQEALYLKFHQALDSQTIADIMGLQPAGVYKLVSTALIRLRKELMNP